MIRMVHDVAALASVAGFVCMLAKWAQILG